MMDIQYFLEPLIINTCVVSKTCVRHFDTKNESNKKLCGYFCRSINDASNGRIGRIIDDMMSSSIW